jgi:hypothetical protein
MKIATYSPNGTLTSKEGSHRTAWAYMRADQISRDGHDVDIVYTKDETKTDWEQYDKIYCYLGMEWAGAINLFGGATDENREKFDRLIGFGDKLEWLDERPIGLGDLIAKRWPNFPKDVLNARATSAPVHTQKAAKYIILGDSHSLNWYIPGASVIRHDGKTLFGALESGISSFLPYIPDELAVCFGNIDIRHHLMRQEHPVPALADLLARLQQQLVDIQRDSGCGIQIVAPIYIEHESRKLPKTGWYKGTPFAGTWAERENLRALMDFFLRDACAHHGWTYLEYPSYFRNESGRMDEEYMEKPGSVHVSWAHGRFGRMLRGEAA